MSEEIDILPRLVTIVQYVIAGAVKVGSSGLFGKVREAQAIMKYFAEARETFAGNPLIEGIIDTLSEDEDEEDPEMIDIGQLEQNTIAGMVDELPGLLANYEQYSLQVKAFIFGLAERIAVAAGKGLFGSGRKVITTEFNYLDALKQQLGL